MLKNQHIQAGLKDVQKSAIKAGVRKIDQVLNPMEEEEERVVVRKKKKKPAPKVTNKTKKKRKEEMFATKRSIFDQ